MTTTNDKEIEFWNGDASARWVKYQDELDRRIRPFGEAAIDGARVREGARVLDVGCGCGDTTIALAARVGPEGRVVGVDVSGPMLARARERAAGLDHVRLEQADATTFSSPEPFDAIVSRFGVMFFTDPVASFENLRRLLAPGATMSFVCWKALAENPWAERPLAAVGGIIGPGPPPDPLAPGPFSLGAEGRVREILSGAGFADVALTPVVRPMSFGDTLEDAVRHAREIGPASRLLRGVEDATLARATDALRAMLAPLARRGSRSASPPFELDAAAWRVTARAP